MEPIKSCPIGKVQEVLCEGNSRWENRYMIYMVKNTKSEVRILSFATSGILKFTKFQISVLFAKSLFQKWENYFSREIWSIILNIVKMKIILKRISIWEQESTKNIWSFWKGNTNMSWEKEMFKCIHTLHYTSMTHLFWMPPRLMSSLKSILETFQHLKNLVIISTSVMQYRSISLDQIFDPTGCVWRGWEASESFPLWGMFWARAELTSASVEANIIETDWREQQFLVLFLQWGTIGHQLVWELLTL